MWKNYLKSGLRSLVRTRMFSLINILGLAIGMASVLTVAIYVLYEMSYDSQWANRDRIARVVFHTTRSNGETGYLTAIPDNVSEIALPQIAGISGSSRYVQMNAQLFCDDKVVSGQITFVEPDFFAMLQPEIRSSGGDNFFPGLDNVVITESAALKYFGMENPVGELLDVNLMDQKHSMIVTAVIQDFPENSIFRDEILAPYQIFFEGAWENPGMVLWQQVASSLFVMVEEGNSIAEIEQRIKTLTLEFDGDTPWGAHMENYFLQPLRQVHVAPSNPLDIPTDSSANSLRLLIIIGLIILALACVNFTTLSISKAATRLREVGVRKVMGAQRVDIVRQFWVETAILSLLAMLIATPLLELILPGFRTLSGSEVTIPWTVVMLPILAGIWLLTTLIAGFYPSLVFSGFRIVAAMKGEQKVGGKGVLRKVLVFVQLSVAVALLSATLVMIQQIRYIQQRDLGFNGEQVVILDAYTDESLDNAAERLRLELAGDPGVLAVSYADCSFKGQWSKMGWSRVDAVKGVAIYNNCVEPQYMDAMQLEMAAGRWFRTDDEADKTGAVVINETMADLIGGKDIVGQTYPDLFDDATIVGVVKDFHFHDLKRSIEPLILVQDWDVFTRFNTLWFEQDQGYVYLRLASNDIPGTMDRVRHAWEKVVPEAEFTFNFLQDEVDAQYRDITRWNRIMTISTGLAILISLLGLIGISVLQVARRTREISVRKVLGASLAQLLTLLSREVLILVALANLVAWPVIWLVMTGWLKNFAYRINLGAIPFLVAGFLVLFVALVTVGLLSLRVVNINPVKTLRSE